NKQSQSSATQVVGDDVASFVERVKNLVVLALGKAQPFVGDQESDVCLVLFYRDSDGAAVGRKFGGILQQVAYHLLQAVAIADHPRLAERVGAQEAMQPF